MAASHLTAFAPMAAPAGRGAGVRAQAAGGAAQNLDPRTR
jgi:hypothetical protein